MSLYATRVDDAGSQVDRRFARRSQAIQRQLKSERDLLQTLLDTIPEAVWSMDADGHFLRVNRAFALQSGFQREEEAIGKTEANISGSPIRLDRTVKEALASATPLQDHPTYVQEPDGTPRWLSTTLIPQRDRQGRLTGTVGIVRDITVRTQMEQELRATNARLKHQLGETVQLQEQLRQQAVRDGLTGVFNRRYFDETLERELAAARRNAQSLTLVMLDIDHFKQINDTYGHAAGDRVIKALAVLLLATTRASDVVARYGGEEFVIILPGATWAYAQQRAEMWREAFAKTTIQCEAAEVTATISLGVATYPNVGRSADSLLRSADQALYAAKTAGRNRIGVK